MKHSLNTVEDRTAGPRNICVPSVFHLWPKLLLLAVSFALLPTNVSAQEKTDWNAAYEKLLESNPDVRKKVDSGGAKKADVIKWLQFMASGGDKFGEEKKAKVTWGKHFPKTAHEYAKMVEPILGVPPKIDLSEAVEIPLFVKGKRTYGHLQDCDNKTFLGKATVSGSTMQRYEGRTADGKPLPDVVWVAFGRNSSFNHKRFMGSVQMIGYHHKSGATAFFESGEAKITPYVTQDKGTQRMRGKLPWIDDPDGFNTAFRTPGTTQCVQCHQNDPFIHDDFIDAAKMPGTDEPVVPVLDKDSPYYVIGGDDWDMRTIHIKGNGCFECHRVGMSTFDLFQSNGWNPNEHMPPHDPGSLADDFRELLTAWQYGPEKVDGAEWVIPPARGEPRKFVGKDYAYAAFFNRRKSKSGGLLGKKPVTKKPPEPPYPNRVVDGQGKKPPVTSVAFGPEGKSLASVSQAGLTVHTWPDLKPQRTIKLKTTNPHCVVFSLDGKHVAVGGGVPSEDGTIEVFSWPELKPIAQLGEHADSVMSVAWQDDDTIVSASLDKEVRVWNIKSGKPVRTFKGHSRGVTSVSFLADRKTMITAGIDQSIRVWNAETGELVRSMAMHTKPIHDIAVRPTTEGLPMIASASDDRTVRLWQPTIGRMVRFAKLPVRPLNVEWLPDGSRVIAVCTDGKAYTIDPDTVEVTNVAPAISGWAWAMQVHPTKNALAVGGPNGTIKRLTLPPLPSGRGPG